MPVGSGNCECGSLRVRAPRPALELTELGTATVARPIRAKSAMLVAAESGAYYDSSGHWQGSGFMMIDS